MQLKTQLPKKLLDHSWPKQVPACLSLTSQLLQKMHKLHQAASYRHSLLPAVKAHLQEKYDISQVFAPSDPGWSSLSNDSLKKIFREKKANYPASIATIFVKEHLPMKLLQMPHYRNAAHVLAKYPQVHFPNSIEDFGQISLHIGQGYSLRCEHNQDRPD